MSSPRKITDAQANKFAVRLGKAMFRASPEALEALLTPDAEWHFAIGRDVPDGRVRKGIDGFIQGIAENKRAFAELRFEDVEVTGFTHDQFIMRYRIAGKKRSGKSLNLRGIEVITVVEDRVSKKDVFWKQEGR